MQDSIQERTGNSSSAMRQFQVGTSLVASVDIDGFELPENYRPCKGTWAEFKHDVGRFFSRLGGEIADRFEKRS